MQDKFNFITMPQQKLKELSMALLTTPRESEIEGGEQSAFRKYLRELSNKEYNGEELTSSESDLLNLQTEVYMEFSEKEDLRKADEAIIDGMIRAEFSLQRLLKNVPMETILKDKPSIADAPEDMPCLALKMLSDKEYEWVWGPNNILGSMFILHESADGSVEKFYQKYREMHNNSFGCNCSCHNPKYDVMHIMPCCSQTYEKMFTRLMPEINFQ